MLSKFLLTATLALTAVSLVGASAIKSAKSVKYECADSTNGPFCCTGGIDVEGTVEDQCDARMCHPSIAAYQGHEKYQELSCDETC